MCRPWEWAVTQVVTWHVLTNQRPVLRSRDLCWPIRGQYQVTWRKWARSYCEGDAIRIRPSQIFDPFKQIPLALCLSWELYFNLLILLSRGRPGGRFRIKYAANVCPCVWDGDNHWKLGNQINMLGDYFKAFPSDRIQGHFWDSRQHSEALMPVKPGEFQVSNKLGPLSRISREFSPRTRGPLFKSNWPSIKPDSARFLFVFDSSKRTKTMIVGSL